MNRPIATKMVLTALLVNAIRLEACGKDWIVVLGDCGLTFDIVTLKVNRSNLYENTLRSLAS